MEWLSIAYSLVCLFLLGFGLYKLYPYLRSELPGKYLPVALISKLTYTLALLCIYRYYYNGGDITSYSREFEYFTKILFENPKAYFSIVFQDAIPEGIAGFLYANDIRTWFFIRVTHPLYLIGGNNYFTSGIFFSLLFFLSAFKFATTIIGRFNLNPVIVIFSFFILPSFSLWCSAFTKETVSMGLLLFALSHMLQWQHTLRKWYLSAAVFLSLYIAVVIKFYFVAPLLAFAMSYLIIEWISQKWNLSLLKSVLILFTLIVILGLFSTQLHYSIKPQYLARSIWVNYFVSILEARPGSCFIFENISPDITGIIKSLPEALLQGLLAPLPGLVHNVLSVFTALENYVLFVLLLFSISKLRIAEHKTILLLISISLFIITSACLLALSSPNPGNLVRYKVVFTPFLSMIALQCIPPRIWNLEVPGFGRRKN